MAFEKIKNSLQGSKIKPGPIHKLKTIKRAMNWTDQTIYTTQKITYIFKILNSIHTICGENCVSSSCVQVSL